MGQVVGGAGAGPVATLQGTEQFQVRVSVPTMHLPGLHIRDYWYGWFEGRCTV